LTELRARNTCVEIERIRTACRIAEQAFRRGASRIEIGVTEVGMAAAFRQPLSECLVDFPELGRADGFTWCMSGANAALAGGAFARSRGKRLDAGDLVLVHLNSYADGYWTDITRTYSLGTPDDQRRAMYDAVFAARHAALDAIHPGAKAAAVDAAARDVLDARGFGAQFTHATGHGVGLSAISAEAKPRVHPASPDTLQPGMVFNVEPAIYIEGYGGIRHCDMVAVTDTGTELLTPFQCALDELVVGR
jgi:Xaa-Pro dipeptidase